MLVQEYLAGSCDGAPWSWPFYISGVEDYVGPPFVPAGCTFCSGVSTFSPALPCICEASACEPLQTRAEYGRCQGGNYTTMYQPHTLSPAHAQFPAGLWAASGAACQANLLLEHGNARGLPGSGRSAPDGVLST